MHRARLQIPNLLLILVLAGVLPRAAIAFWDPITARCTPPALEGRASAIDGDSLELIGPDGTRTVIHLMSLAAPELFQDCRADDGAWSCGREARRVLQSLLEGRDLACLPCGPDGSGRIEAVCRDGEVDIGAEMLRSGLATSNAYFSNALRTAEVEARRAGRGLWRGDWVHPQAWRQGARLGAGPCQGCLLPR